jgi:transcriptional regulator with XRE-family HTH domain
VPLDPLPDWVLACRQAIGDRIRAARLRANLSQVALGERVGRDHKTIHRYEYGTSVASVDDLILIADACGIPLAQLVDEGPARR